MAVRKLKVIRCIVGMPVHAASMSKKRGFVVRIQRVPIIMVRKVLNHRLLCSLLHWYS